MTRGQLSLELFLVLTFVSMLLLWATNFSVIQNEAAGKVAVSKQALALANSLAQVMNQISYANSNSELSFEAPCIYSNENGAIQALPYEISTSPGKLTITINKITKNAKLFSNTTGSKQVLQCPSELLLSSIAGRVELK